MIAVDWLHRMGDGSRTMMTTALGKPSVHHFNAFYSYNKKISECILNSPQKFASQIDNSPPVIMRKMTRIIHNAVVLQLTFIRNRKLVELAAQRRCRTVERYRVDTPAYEHSSCGYLLFCCCFEKDDNCA